MTPISLTLFKSKSASEKFPVAWTLDTLCEKILAKSAPKKELLPWVKFAKFGDKFSDKGSLRHDDNVLAITGIELDYDGEKVSFESAVDKLKAAGIYCLVCTTPSYSPSAPRWRVYCPTSQELHPSERKRLAKRANNAVGNICASESFTLSQAFYYGHINDGPHYACVVEGKFIDDCVHLDQPVSDNIPASVPAKTSQKRKPISTEALRSILAALPVTDFQDGKAWRGLACAISDATGHAPDAGKMFAAWSAGDPQYGVAGAAAALDWYNRLKDERPNGITKGTLAHILLQRGLSHLMRKRDGEKIAWRERTNTGHPAKAMHNAMLCIKDLGIVCKRDLFREVTTVGYIDDEISHDVAPLIGEFSDNVLTRLRGIISDAYGVDMGDQAIFDAVNNMALQNAFDPVLDEIAAARAAYDGKPRIDSMLHDYFGADDTPLIRAFSSKTMLALVARPQVPGIKKDEILVCESKEGHGKSTAFEILVGEDFFSDQSLLGKSDKEMQELLTGTWLHENADLAGMRRADVEQVKAGLSRKTDRARKAYGRVVEKRKRRSIEVGTTNEDDGYLQSQTGNRRVWGVRTGKIDLEGLRRDRTQLIGEAATRFANGESLHLDPSLWEAAGDEQEKRREHDPWEDHLEHIPAKWIHADKTGRQMVSSAELLVHVVNVPIENQTGAHGRRLGRCMKRCGWSRNDSGRVQWADGAKPVRGFWRYPLPADKPDGGLPF